MSAMDYRSLGTTGLQVSRIALGCGNFGGIGSAPEFYGQGETDEEAFAIMDAAFEVGINVFDTANAYGGGRSETAIGRWLAKRGSAVRDQVLLSTKAFNPVGDGPNDRGLSRRALFRAVDASLQRLGAERIDLFLCHEPDPATPLEETLAALDDLRRAGKLHYIGASNIEAWRLARGLWISDVRGLARFEWVQSGYSLLDRSPEAEVLPLCADQGLGFSPFSPLCGGWLTGKYRRDQAPPPGSRMTLRSGPYEHLQRPEVFDALEAFEAKAAERGVDLPTLALAWLLAHPLINPIVVGPRRPEHLQPALAALELKLGAGERDELSALFPPTLGAAS
jgi:aryl-alcohol dehydrogenase-like predicted oxidoreductase